MPQWDPSRGPLVPGTRFDCFETLSEYIAEEEAEAAMLQAELAMSMDESSLICDEGFELVELAHEEMSAEETRGSPNFDPV
jgi:hypothetical protein